MNRIHLLAELAAAGKPAPANITPDALFDCVDALRRLQGGEKPGLPTSADLVVIHHSTGPEFCRPKALPSGPELDPWPQSRPVARALASLS